MFDFTALWLNKLLSNVKLILLLKMLLRLSLFLLLISLLPLISEFSVFFFESSFSRLITSCLINSSFSQFDFRRLISRQLSRLNFNLRLWANISHLLAFLRRGVRLISFISSIWLFLLKVKSGSIKMLLFSWLIFFFLLLGEKFPWVGSEFKFWKSFLNVNSCTTFSLLQFVIEFCFFNTPFFVFEQLTLFILIQKGELSFCLIFFKHIGFSLSTSLSCNSEESENTSL